ncbi:MAG: epimerase [Bacteroidota bacterium]
MSIKAIIFGATGMVGEGVLHEALKSPSVESVLVIGRRPCYVSHPKLREIVHADFYDYSEIEKQFTGYNACLFCLGVTSIGKDEQKYTRLTYDLTMAAARTLVRLNSEMVFCYVSGLGTDSSERGRSMWARVKGKTENDLRKLPFKAVYAYRPGFIRPTPGLKNTLAFAKPLSPLYPILKVLLPGYVCTLEDVGRSMIHVAQHGHAKNILECKDITRSAMQRVGATIE